MKSLIIFSTKDIGSNYRLLHHAKSFALMSNSKVLILAPDISSLPKEIENMNNIHHMYFYSFVHTPILVSFLLSPIKALFYAIQLFIVSFFYPEFEFVLTSYDNPFLLSFCLSKWCRSKLIVDYSYLSWSQADYKLGFLRRIEEYMLSFADFHICSTQAIQFVLKIRKIKAIVIHDQPGELFKPNRNCKSDVFQILGIRNTYHLCGIPFPTASVDNIKSLLTIGRSLEKEQIEVCFIIFTCPKAEKEIAKSIENQSFKKTLFKILSLNTDAYAYILGCCDFGILLNTTQYGLEMSPEFTNMVGCHLPTLAFKHGCASEVIKNGINGYIFSNFVELAEYIKQILIDKTIDLGKMRESFRENDRNRKEEWDSCFKNLFLF